MATNTEVRTKIAQSIADAVQKGCAPWRRPWGNTPGTQGVPMTLPVNFLTARRYSGVNPLLLMMACEVHGFNSPYWGSMNQWSQIGAYIRPRPHHVPNGHWGTGIVFYTTVEKKRKEEDVKPAIPTEDGEVDRYMILRQFTVFNADQVTAPDVEMILKAQPKVQKSLAKRALGRNIRQMTRSIAEEIRKAVEKRLEAYRTPAQPVVAPGEVYEEAERFLTATGAKIRYGGDQAFYRHRPGDFIQLPPRTSFDTLSDFYETAYHELGHWAEADHRLGQSPKHKGHKGEPYAFSELVAEIGSCYLASETGLPIHQDMLPRSQSYVKYWLSQMGSDPKYIFEAATQAGKVVDYLLSFRESQPCPTPIQSSNRSNRSLRSVAG